MAAWPVSTHAPGRQPHRRPIRLRPRRYRYAASPSVFVAVWRWCCSAELLSPVQSTKVWLFLRDKAEERAAAHVIGTHQAQTRRRALAEIRRRATSADAAAGLQARARGPPCGRECLVPDALATNAVDPVELRATFDRRGANGAAPPGHRSRRGRSAQGRSRNTSCRFRRNSSRAALRRKRGGERRSNLGAPAPRNTRRVIGRALGRPELLGGVIGRALGRPELLGGVIGRALGRPELLGGVIGRALGRPELLGGFGGNGIPMFGRTQCERIGSDPGGATRHSCRSAPVPPSVRAPEPTWIPSRG